MLFEKSVEDHIVMKPKKHIHWLLLIVLFYSIWPVNTVSAHGLLVQSNPQANAVLEQAPVQVELFFTEPLEPTLSSIEVIDSNNFVVDAGDVRVDSSNPKRMTVTLHSIADGVYTVSWKALSTIDGHQTVGSFAFAVGNENAATVGEIQQSTTARLPVSALIAKFLLLISLAIMIGQRLFIWLIWQPVLKSNQGNSSIAWPPVWRILYRCGLIGVTLSIGLGILSQAGQTTGNELSLPWSTDTGFILTGTRLGIIWLLRLALAILAVWLAGSKEFLLKDWVEFVVNLILLLTVTLMSHAATDAKPLLPILGDWLHLVGMTFWLGGLIYLFTGIRHIQYLEDSTRTKLTSLLAARFSINAIIFVSLIGVTGFYSAYLRVGTWSALLTSLYGHVMLIKQAFVAGLLIIAATNLLIISPRLKRVRMEGLGSEALVKRFGKNLIIELTLAGLLLGSVSFLTYIPPAKIVAVNSSLNDRTKAEDLKFDINISPGRIGQNTFTLRLDSNEGPVQSAKEVLLRFTTIDGNIPPSEIEMYGLGDGTFVAKGAHLSLPGSWQVQAIVRREDKFDVYANFDFTLGSSDGIAERFAISRQAALLLIVIGILFGLLTTYTEVNSILRFGLGMPIVLIMLSLGIFQLTRPAPIKNINANPIPPNRESIAAGQALYSIQCASCHGETGKGDGPVGLTLNPRPADLVQHAVQGIHPDAQLFEWITNGFLGTAMPSFKTVLSDTDRWHLVNFIRTLAPQ